MKRILLTFLLCGVASTAPAQDGGSLEVGVRVVDPNDPTAQVEYVFIPTEQAAQWWSFRDSHSSVFPVCDEFLEGDSESQISRWVDCYRRESARVSAE